MDADEGLSLRPHSSTIDVEGLPGHEGRIVTGKERDCADEVFRHFYALDRLHLRNRIKLLIHRF